MTERDDLESAIAALEAQRGVLGDKTVDTLVAAARQKLAALETVSPAEPVSPLPREEIIPIEERRKLVTMLFADVVGFTAMAEHMDAEDVRDTMNALWQRLDQAILRRGGQIDKHIGDAVMAVWGGQVSHEDDAAQAVRAALDMQAALEQTNLSRRSGSSRGAEPVEADLASMVSIRVGIHSGPVLLGKVGTTGEYTAIGDTVNVASRLQQAAPPGGIIISQDTYRQVHDQFDLLAQEPLVVKGKSEAISVYVVQRARGRQFRMALRGLKGLAIPTVGREGELRQLKDTLARVMERRLLEAVTVVGEAGVGKTRLVYEFERRLADAGQALEIFRCRADVQMSALPYALIRDLFANRFGILDSDRSAAARRKLERGIGEYLGGERPEAAHFIGHLIGFDFSASPYLRGILEDAKQIHARAILSMAQFINAAAQKAPLLILVEDLHWADDRSLDLLSYLVQECKASPILILGAARRRFYERRPDWGRDWPAHTRLDLYPLSDQDSRRMVNEIMARISQAPAQLKDLIVAKAEGNPYYLEELINILIEDRVIVEQQGQWRVVEAELSNLRLPDTLAGILQARLDSLPIAERTVAQRSAVIGRIFWDTAVATLSEADRLGSEQALVSLGLDSLQAKDLVFRREQSAFASAQEFAFKHALLHEVAYESVLKRDRRRYHAQAADWLIQHSGERGSEYAGLIGEHYLRAAQKVMAATWFERAGRRAQQAYAPDDALQYYQKAMALLPDSDEHADLKMALYRGLGQMLLWKARYADALEAFQSMRKMAEVKGDAVGLARAWNELGAMQNKAGQYREALASTQQAEQIARQAEIWFAVALALSNQAVALYRLGEIRDALEKGLASLTLFEDPVKCPEDPDMKPHVIYATNILGNISLSLGHYQQAVAYYERVLSMYQEGGDLTGTVMVLNNLGAAAHVTGDYAAAAVYYLDGLANSRELKNRAMEIILLSNLAGTHVGLGAYAEAVAELEQVIEMAQAEKWYSLTEVYRFLAEAYCGQNKLAQALDAVSQALQLGQSTGSREYEGRAWRVLGGIIGHPDFGMVSMEQRERCQEMFSGRCDDAAACFAESERLFVEMGADGERARTLRDWGKYEIGRGDRILGERLLREAGAIFKQLGMVKELERMGGKDA